MLKKLAITAACALSIALPAAAQNVGALKVRNHGMVNVNQAVSNPAPTPVNPNYTFGTTYQFPLNGAANQGMTFGNPNRPNYSDPNYNYYNNGQYSNPNYLYNRDYYPTHRGYYPPTEPPRKH